MKIKVTEYYNLRQGGGRLKVVAKMNFGLSIYSFYLNFLKIYDPQYSGKKRNLPHPHFQRH